MKIFIVGFMGSGKSTWGKRIAARLKLDFFDLDRTIETFEGQSIPEIFAQNGEERFRELEAKYLRTWDQMDNYLLSTGGGTPCYYNNMEWMLQKGTCIYLRMTVTQLAHRLANDTGNRPALKGLSPAERLEFIENTLASRSAFYEKSQIITDGMNLKSRPLSTLLAQIVEKSRNPA